MSHNAHGAVVGVNDWPGDGIPGSGGNGGWFETSNGEGVRGLAHGIGHGGVVGVCDNHTPQAGPGVYGESAGVCGEHKSSGAGVVGKSVSGVGVWGVSDTFEGVHAETNSTVTAAMAVYQMNAGSGSAAFFAKHAGNLTAGRFEGNVEVTGHINGGAGTIPHRKSRP